MREFELLEHVYAANAELARHVRIGPGDDMAMVDLDGGRLLVAVDQIVAGKHVDLDTTPLELVGRKAITRSLSDIAAMAGKPVASLVAVTLPPDFGSKRATTLFDAMRKTAADYDCPLIGGDIAIHNENSHPLTCSVTVLATPSGEHVVTRDGAKAGDGVYVTGRLGGSLLPDGTGHHLTFEPRIKEAIELYRHLGTNLHAMIDISDGLGRDAAHIAEASGVSIQIDARLIPCRPGIEWRQAASEGEDYELCFTASGELPTNMFELEVTRIGEVFDRKEPEKSSRGEAGGGSRGVVFLDGASELPGDELGWQHES